jgi:hypothetical protein
MLSTRLSFGSKAAHAKVFIMERYHPHGPSRHLLQHLVQSSLRVLPGIGKPLDANPGPERDRLQTQALKDKAPEAALDCKAGIHNQLLNKPLMNPTLQERRKN